MEHVDAVRLIGRNRERQSIVRLLAQGAAGRGGILVLEGSSGMGKTRILQEAEKAATCLDFEISSFLIPATGGLRRDYEIDKLLTALDRVDVGNPRPKLIIVDDLHEMTVDVANSVFSLHCPDGPAPLVWLFGLRTHHDSRTVRQFLGEIGAGVRIELDRLSGDAAAELAAELLGTRMDAALTAMVGGAGGNPLLILELIRGLREEGCVTIVGGQAGLTEARVPQRVLDVTQTWLSGMSQKARQLVQVAAALGEPFTIGEIAAMQQETTASMLPALNEAMAAGLLTCPGERGSFQHELVRRAVAEALPTAVRQALCSDIKNLRNDLRMRALPVLGSFSQATRADPKLGLRAVGAGPDSGERGLADQLVPALLLTRSVCTEPLSPSLAKRLRAELAAILTAAGSAPAPADRAARNIVALYVDDERRAVDRARAVLSTAAGTERGSDALAAMVVLSNLQWAAGDLTEALSWGRDAVACVGEATPPVWRPYTRLALAAKLSDLCRFDEAQTLISAAQEEVERLGLTEHTAASLILRAGLLLRSGRLKEAHDAANAGLSAAAQAESDWVTPAGQAVLLLVASHITDLPSVADHEWHRSTAPSTDGCVFPSIHFAWAQCVTAIADLDSQQAAEVLTSRYADLLTRAQLFTEETDAASLFVRIALAAGDMSLAAIVVETVEKLASANRAHPTLRVSAAHARGLLEKDPDALLQASKEHLSPCSRALAEEDLGVMLASISGGDDESASESLLSALRRFDQIGATADADRIRRRLGEDRAPTARECASAASRWDALTDAEQVIARLVGDGLTNRQVARRVSLSPHTVNYHLRVIFRKLDISSRVEVVRHISSGV